MPSAIQSRRTESRLSRCLLLHFLRACSIIFTVTDSLRLSTDSHLLTSERTSLMHWASKPRMSSSGSRYLWFKGVDEAALRKCFAVVDFMIVLIMVLLFF